MTRTLFGALALALSLSAASPAFAASEAVTKAKTHLKEVKAELKDAEKDKKKLDKAVAQFLDAWADENWKKVHSADAKLKEWMQAEMQENREEVQDAREKADAAGGERAADRAEEALDQAQDVRRNVKAIIAEIREIQPKFDEETAKRPAGEKKAALLTELQKTAAREVHRAEKDYEKAQARLDRAKSNS